MQKVNLQVVEWALKWNGLSVEELAKSSCWKFLPLLMNEGKQPTFKQIEKLAARTHTLVPYFFSDSIPSVCLPIPDFRTHAKSTQRAKS